ncbi:MAG: GAF domain-containing protein [Cyanobacteria bacterium P01_F01_bin.53]
MKVTTDDVWCESGVAENGVTQSGAAANDEVQSGVPETAHVTAAPAQQSPELQPSELQAPEQQNLKQQDLKQQDRDQQESLVALATYNRELRQRDALLNGVNAAAQCLVAQDDLTRAIPEALRILGERTQQERIYVLENVYKEGSDDVFWSIPYEWNGPGLPNSSILGKNVPIPMKAFPAPIVEKISTGKPIQLLTRNVTGIALIINQARFAKSLVAVPISVAGQWWGIMGFDDCTTERIWSEAEIAVLETAAACVGSAIERDRTRKERESTARARATELETYNQQLRARDALLNCVNAAAQCLVATEELSEALPTMLKILGEGTNQCRAYILNNTQDNQTGDFIFNLMLEWDAPNIPSKIEVGGRFPVPVNNFPDHLTAPLRAGQAMQFFARELDGIGPEERAKGKARSLLSVPVSVSGQWWGLLGIDDCFEERIWSDAEIAVLETAATALGNAIERDLARKAREVAERDALIAQERTARAAELEAANKVLRSRDRWLETTAVAANELLSALPPEVSVTAALKTIGENLGSDRLGIMRYCPEKDSPEKDPPETDSPEKDKLGKFCALYDWHASDSIQTTAENAAENALDVLPASDFSDWTKRLMAGESVGGLVANLAEPFRSKMQTLNTLSTYAVPIFISTEVMPVFWGLMYMDYCREARQLAPAELAVFNTAATCVGSAIHREQMLQRRQQAERTALLEQEREQAAQARAAQLQASNQILSLRERWLNATAAAAGELLSADTVESAINNALRILGEGTDVDRTVVVRLLKDLAGRTLGVGRVLHEWTSPFAKPLMGKARKEISNEGLEDWFPRLLAGDWVGGTIDDFHEPFKSEQLSMGVKSTYIVPIVLNGQTWGSVSVDHCREKRRLSEAEISVFKTAASCIGSAIQRDRIRRAREAAEHNILIEREQSAQSRAAQLQKSNEVLSLRERWLDITAAAANKLLLADDLEGAIAPTMQILGEGINADRVGIMNACEKDGKKIYRMFAEWASDGQPSQTEGSDIQEIPAEILGDKLNGRLEGGHWVGGDIEDSTIFPDDLRDGLKSLGIQTSYSVPIFVSGQFWGVIGIDHCRTKTQLSETEIAVFQTIASCFGNAIQRDQILHAREQAEKAILEEREQAARDRAAELAKTNEAIGKTLTTLASSPELDQFLGTILAEMAQQVEACKVHLFLYDEPTDTLTQRVAVQSGRIYIGNAPNEPNLFRLPIPANITAGWNAIISGECPLTDDDNLPDSERPPDDKSLPDDKIWWPQTLEWHQQQGHKAITYIPMKAGEQPIGYIGFFFYQQAVLTDEQLEFMQALTNQAIVAIQLTRLAQQNQSVALTAALTDERNRLAREIHDTLAQSFTGVSLQLEAARSLTAQLHKDANNPVSNLEEVQTHILRARDLARKGLSEARRSVRALRSEALETDALPEALLKTLNQTTYDTGLVTHFSLKGEPFPLPDNIQLNLLRIAQEAITNVLRHAQATRLDLTLIFSALSPNNRVQLLIVDNGIGFNTTSLLKDSGFGLIGIRERTDRCLGTFKLLSRPGGGTTLDILIPLT